MSSPEEKKKTMIDHLPKWYMMVVVTLLTGISVAIVIGGGKYLNDVSSRTFSNVDKKVRTETFIDDAPTREQLDIVVKHTSDPGVHMSKEAKDSVYVTRLEYEDLIRQLAIDNYNAAKKLDRKIDLILDNQELNKTAIKILDWKVEQLEKKK